MPAFILKDMCHRKSALPKCSESPRAQGRPNISLVIILIKLTVGQYNLNCIPEYQGFPPAKIGFGHLGQLKMYNFSIFAKKTECGCWFFFKFSHILK